MSLPKLQPLKLKLPALDGQWPRILVDTREQTPLVFTQLISEPATLTTADYSYSGGEHVFGVERKSVADLVGCCTGLDRARFERELLRLRSFRFKRLLVVGRQEDIEAGRYHSRIAPGSVLGTVAMIEHRYEVPVVFCDTPEDAARLVESWVCWSARELLNAANHLARRLSEQPERGGADRE